MVAALDSAEQVSQANEEDGRKTIFVVGLGSFAFYERRGDADLRR